MSLGQRSSAGKEFHCTGAENLKDRFRIQNEHVYAICCRPDVGDDVISVENVNTFEGYSVINLESAGSSFLPWYSQKIIS